jgi:integrase
MTERAKVGGSIRKMPNREFWQGRYTGADGRRHSLYAKTRRDVQEHLRAALTQADNGVRPVGHRLTLAAYLQDWLATSVAPRCRRTTAESYESIVRLYLIPALGRQPLAKLEPADVQRMLAALQIEGRLSERASATCTPCCASRSVGH